MTKLQISNFKLRQISSYILCSSYPYSSLETYPFIAIKNVAKKQAKHATLQICTM